MATTITLEGAARTEFGKGAARRMRVANLIPATVYAGGEDPVFVQLPMKETTLSLRHTNALFTIKYGDETKMAVVKDVQRNPVKRIVEHVDFYEVKAGEKIDVEVPVFVEGTRSAAVAFVDIQELKVRADVANLPEKIVVNVDGLTDGSKVFAKDVVLPEASYSMSRIRKNPSSPSRCRKMPHRLRPLRLLTPLPLRLLTLSEPYRCLYWLLHKHEVAGEEGVRMGPFLLYEDRYLISRTPVIESVYGVREYIPEPGATSAGDQ
mgnify:FL=1